MKVIYSVKNHASVFLSVTYFALDWLSGHNSINVFPVEKHVARNKYFFLFSI